MFLAENLKTTAKCEHRIWPDKYTWTMPKSDYPLKEAASGYWQTFCKKFQSAICTKERLPCARGAVERMRDWGVGSNFFRKKRKKVTIPPSFSCENATSLYTREAWSKCTLVILTKGLFKGYFVSNLRLPQICIWGSLFFCRYVNFVDSICFCCMVILWPLLFWALQRFPSPLQWP